MTSKPILNDVGLFLKKRFCIFAMHKKYYDLAAGKPTTLVVGVVRIH